MKRFEASVEDLLLGKCGIAWNYLYQQYCGYYRTCKNGTVTQQAFWPDYVYFTPSLMELLGILEYELDRIRIVCKSGNCSCVLNCFQCAEVVNGLAEAKKIVRSEIQKIQGVRGNGN
jgi:hypothetical protein